MGITCLACFQLFGLVGRNQDVFSPVHNLLLLLQQRQISLNFSHVQAHLTIVKTKIAAAMLASAPAKTLCHRAVDIELRSSTNAQCYRSE
eukprot:753216-Hanusia_phi.AAC.8